MLAGCATAVLASGLCLWLATLGLGRSRTTLTRLEMPSLSATSCLVRGSATRSGPVVELRSEWETDDDLVGVLNAYARQGWDPITHMTHSVELLPVRPVVIELGGLQVRVLRGVSLSYTDDRRTHIAASTSLVFCLL